MDAEMDGMALLRGVITGRRGGGRFNSGVFGAVVLRDE